MPQPYFRDLNYKLRNSLNQINRLFLLFVSFSQALGLEINHIANMSCQDLTVSVLISTDMTLKKFSNDDNIFKLIFPLYSPSSRENFCKQYIGFTINHATIFISTSPQELQKHWNTKKRNIKGESRKEGFKDKVPLVSLNTEQSKVRKNCLINIILFRK